MCVFSFLNEFDQNRYTSTCDYAASVIFNYIGHTCHNGLHFMVEDTECAPNSVPAPLTIYVTSISYMLGISFTETILLYNMHPQAMSSHAHARPIIFLHALQWTTMHPKAVHEIATTLPKARHLSNTVYTIVKTFIAAIPKNVQGTCNFVKSRSWTAYWQSNTHPP